MGGNKHVRHCTVRAMARPLTMANDDVGWCSAERKWSHGMSQGAFGGSMQTSIEGKSRRRQADRVIHHSVSCPLTLVCPWAAWRQRWLLIPKAPSAQRCILTPHHHLGLGVGTAADVSRSALSLERTTHKKATRTVRSLRLRFICFRGQPLLPRGHSIWLGQRIHLGSPGASGMMPRCHQERQKSLRKSTQSYRVQSILDY